MKFVSKILIVLIMLSFLFSCEPKIKNGFIIESSGEKTSTYYYSNGKKLTGWQEIEGEWYYFYKENEKNIYGKYNLGAMKCGTWLQEGNDFYFFDHDGKMLRDVLRKLDDGKMYYFDSNGKMLRDTEKTVGEKNYRIDSNGVAHKQPDYMLTFNCTFPKSFYCSKGEIIIENIQYTCHDASNGRQFELYWTGTDGYHSKYYINESTRKYVGWKLYDPDGYVIDTGTFMTEALSVGDKFRNEKEKVGWGKLSKKGVYKLELLNSTR